MLKLRYKQVSEYKKEVEFRNPKCGHKQKFEYSSPYVCQETACSEKPISVEKLLGDRNQDCRVRYFVSGTI